MPKLSDLRKNNNGSVTSTGPYKKLSELRTGGYPDTVLGDLMRHKNIIVANREEEKRKATEIPKPLSRATPTGAFGDNSLIRQHAKDLNAASKFSTPSTPKLDDNALAYQSLKDKAASEKQLKTQSKASQIKSLIDSGASTADAYKTMTGTPAQDALDKYVKERQEILTDGAYEQARDRLKQAAQKEQSEYMSPENLWLRSQYQVDNPLAQYTLGYADFLRNNPATIKLNEHMAPELEKKREEEAKKLEDWAADMAAKKPLISPFDAASAASVFTSLLSGGDYINRLTEQATIGKTLNTPGITATDATQALRGGVVRDKSDLTKFLYNTAMSGVDSFVASLGGPGGAVMLGLGAASNTYNDIKARGGSERQAFVGGAVAGVFESLFENLSIEKLNAMKRLPIKDAKSIFSNITKSTVTNLAEEAATEIANIAFDIFNMQDLSGYSYLVRSYEAEYIGAGMSESEAKAKAEKSAKWALLDQVLQAAASGALMGAAFGGGATLRSDLASTIEGRNYKDAGLRYDLVDLALRGDKNSDSYKMAEAIGAKFDEGKAATVSARDIGRLSDMMKYEAEQKAAAEAKQNKPSLTDIFKPAKAKNTEFAQESTADAQQAAPVTEAVEAVAEQNAKLQERITTLEKRAADMADVAESRAKTNAPTTVDTVAQNQSEESTPVDTVAQKQSESDAAVQLTDGRSVTKAEFIDQYMSSNPGKSVAFAETMYADAVTTNKLGNAYPAAVLQKADSAAQEGAGAAARRSVGNETAELSGSESVSWASESEPTRVQDWVVRNINSVLSKQEGAPTVSLDFGMDMQENGYFDADSNTIILNGNKLTTQEQIEYTLAHEMLHPVETADGGTLVNDVLAFAEKSIGSSAVQSKIDDTRETYIKFFMRKDGLSRMEAEAKVSNSYAKGEVAADLMSELMSDTGGLSRLANENKTVLERLIDVTERFLSDIKGNSTEAKALSNEAEALVDRMYSALHNAASGATMGAEKRSSVERDNKPYPVFDTEYTHREIDDDIEGWSQRKREARAKYDLTPDEHKAVGRYVGGGAYEWTSIQRGEDKFDHTEFVEFWINLAKSGFLKMPAYEGRTYRNLVFDDNASFEKFIAEHSEGNEVMFVAFTSASKDPNGYVVKDGKVVHLVIDGTSGRDIADSYSIPSQREVVYMPGTVIRIGSVSVANDGNTLIFAQEVNQNGEDVPADSGRNGQSSPGAVDQGRGGTYRGDRRSGIREGRDESRTGEFETEVSDGLIDSNPNNTETRFSAAAEEGVSFMPSEDIAGAEEGAGDAGKRYSVDSDYMAAVERGDMETAQRMVDEAAETAMASSKIRGKDGKLKPVYHGTNDTFYKFDSSIKGGVNGTAEGFGIYTSDNPEVTEAYGDRQIKMYANITKPAASDKKTISAATLAKLIKDTSKKQAQKMVDDGEYDSVREAIMDTWVSNYVYTYDIGMERAYREVADSILQMNDNDMEVIQEVMSGMGIRDYAEANSFYRESLTPITGFDGFVTQWGNSNTGEKSNIILTLNSNQLKSADPVTYDDSGNIIPLSQRFNAENKDIRYSVDRDSTYAPTFYSQMERVLTDLKQEKLDANTITKVLLNKGVKAEEIKWTGVEEFLEGKKSVTKSELLDFIRNNQLEIEEVELSGDGKVMMNDETGEIFPDFETFEYSAIAEAVEMGYDPDEVKFEDYGDAWDAYVYRRGEGTTGISSAVLTDAGVADTRWSEYTTEGGTNYREYLFRMPNSSYSNDAMRAHWGDAEGVLAHARVQDFDVNGESVMFIEEIQSDWHNEGHKKGYRTMPKTATEENSSVELEDGRYVLYVDGERTEETVGVEFLARRFKNGISDKEILEGLVLKYNAHSQYDTRPPEAPYSKNYHEFVLKNLLRKAAEGGYSYLAWTPGKMQEARWSSEYAEGYRIEYDQDIPKFLNKFGKQFGAKVTTIQIDENYDQGYVDERIRLLERDRAEWEAELEKPGASVSADFIQSLIDACNKEIEQLKQAGHVWAIPITDAMRKSVLYEGQPRYSVDKDSSTDLDINPDTGYTRGSIMDSATRIFNVRDRDGAVRVLQDYITALDEIAEMHNKKLQDDRALKTFNPQLDDKRIESNKREIQKLIERFGKMEQTSGAQQEVNLPKKIDKDTKVRGAVQTLSAHNETSKVITDNIAEEILSGNAGLTYTPVSDKDTLKAVEKINKEGFKEMRSRWNAVVEGDKLPSKEDIALGEALYLQACKEKRVAEAMQLIAEISVVGTKMGQAVQAFSLLKKMTPTGKAYYLQKTVDSMNNSVFFDKRGIKLTLDKKLVENLLTATLPEDVQKAEDEIVADLARQIPPTVADRIDLWRYTAMLINPRTHVRNIIGNTLFAPLRTTKDALATLIEAAAIKDTSKRTKAVKVDSKLMEFAYADADLMQEELQGGGKHGLKEKIMSQRDIFGYGDSWFAEKVGKKMDAFAQWNSDTMETEDWGAKIPFTDFRLPGLRNAYAKALGGFLQARGLTVDRVRGENSTPEGRATLDQARLYAMKEAQKATYRDYSKLASQINQLQRNSSGVGKILWGGILPFTKTPINVLRRGVEYSPAGLVVTAFKGTVDLKKGDITATEYIDRLSAGMTGSAVAALGYFLSKIGMLVGSMGDDDEDKFAELQGYQEYSINVGDKNYTLDWAAPFAIPLFFGAEVNKFLEESAEGTFDGGTVFESLMSLANPMLAMSMLSGINDTIESVRYDREREPFVVIAESVIGSYFGQFIPSIGGAVARIADENARTTFTPAGQKGTKNTVDRWYQTNILGKTPFLSQGRMLYIDNWGRVDTDENILSRMFANLLSPGYANDVTSTPMESELERLAKATGEKNVFPDKAPKSFYVDGESYAMTQDEYEAHLIDRGQRSYKLVSDITNDVMYIGLDDKTRAEAIVLAYDYAATVAKLNTNSGYAADKWIKELYGLEKNGYDVTTYLMLRADMNVKNIDKTGSDRVDILEVSLGNDAVTETDLLEIIVMDDGKTDSFNDPYTTKSEYKLTAEQQEQYKKFYSDHLADEYRHLTRDKSYRSASASEKYGMLKQVMSEVRAMTRQSMADWLRKRGVKPTPTN